MEYGGNGFDRKKISRNDTTTSGPVEDEAMMVVVVGGKGNVLRRRITRHRMYPSSWLVVPIIDCSLRSSCFAAPPAHLPSASGAIGDKNFELSITQLERITS